MPVAATSTSAANKGNLFRYDATERQYISNLNTKLMQVGTYQLSIDLGDGVPRTVLATLRWSLMIRRGALRHLPRRPSSSDDLRSRPLRANLVIRMC